MASRGFTLIELLVVLALMALVVVVASPLISTAFPGTELKVAARDLAAGLRYARSQAITRNAEVEFVLDVANGRFAIGGGKEIGDLPSGLDISLVTARSETFGETTGAIRFFPDGSSTGGGIRLAGGAREYHVMVDWLTGRVSVLD